MARSHGDRFVAFPPKDDKGALAAIVFFLGPMFSDDMEGGGEEDKFVVGVDDDFSLWRVGVGILVEGKIPDQKIPAHRRIVSSQNLAAKHGYPPFGKGFLI
jgi:hypothetical protein